MASLQSHAAAEPAGDHSVAAVVVNWNGWRDTVICLESLLALADAPAHVVVCDNGSTDGSMAEFAKWARVKLVGWSGHDRGPFVNSSTAGVRSVTFLPLAKNLGYAGGINAGVRWAQSMCQASGFWLLNNDVHAGQEALTELVAASHVVAKAGICGSVLMEWNSPGEVQAVGGMFRRWLGVGWHLKEVPSDSDRFTTAIDYPVGASMFVTSEYVRNVGLMDDSYFLYCEEMDWVERGRRHGFTPVVALRSRLRHKEGASTGSQGGVRNKSLLSEHFGVVNRLRITRKFWPWLLPVVWLSLFAVIMDRLIHREYARAALVLRLMFSPSQWLR